MCRQCNWYLLDGSWYMSLYRQNIHSCRKACIGWRDNSVHDSSQLQRKVLLGIRSTACRDRRHGCQSRYHDNLMRRRVDRCRSILFRDWCSEIPSQRLNRRCNRSKVAQYSTCILPCNRLHCCHSSTSGSAHISPGEASSMSPGTPDIGYWPVRCTWYNRYRSHRS